MDNFCFTYSIQCLSAQQYSAGHQSIISEIDKGIIITFRESSLWMSPTKCEHQCGLFTHCSLMSVWLGEGDEPDLFLFDWVLLLYCGEAVNSLRRRQVYIGVAQAHGERKANFKSQLKQHGHSFIRFLAETWRRRADGGCGWAQSVLAPGVTSSAPGGASRLSSGWVISLMLLQLVSSAGPWCLFPIFIQEHDLWFLRG